MSTLRILLRMLVYMENFVVNFEKGQGICTSVLLLIIIYVLQK